MVTGEERRGKGGATVGVQMIWDRREKRLCYFERKRVRDVELFGMKV